MEGGGFVVVDVEGGVKLGEEVVEEGGVGVGGEDLDFGIFVVFHNLIIPLFLVNVNIESV